MVHLLHTDGIDAAKIPPSREGLPAAEFASWTTHKPNAHCVAVENDQTVARCSIWWNSVPAFENERLGVIGHYAALDAGYGNDLLGFALQKLSDNNCSLAVGPMDGNTWRRYRFVVERGQEPPFLLEPNNPDAYPQHFVQSGFGTLAEYTSALTTELSRLDDQTKRAKARMAEDGITIRNFNPADFEAELLKIYEVSAISFRSNFLYTRLSEDDFIAQYQGIREQINPQTILMAECAGAPVGYVFALPDWLQAARGIAVDTLILKTLARLPERKYAGLGHVLVQEVKLRAYELGFRRAIHALMHSANNSRNVGRGSIETMRRYALFSRKL